MADIPLRQRDDQVEDEAARKRVPAPVHDDGLSARPEDAAELAQAAAPFGWRLALDASQLTMLPSVGLGALVNLNKTAKSNGGKLAIFNLASEILEVMKLTRLDRVVTIVKDRDAALKAVS